MTLIYLRLMVCCLRINELYTVGLHFNDHPMPLRISVFVNEFGNK
jgi:hypothetical protein